jgi:hypothetical protein
MDCPHCKLVNPPTARRCDCGYDFQTRTIQQYIAERRKEIQTAWFCLFALLGFCLLPWFYLFGLTGMMGDSGSPLSTRDHLFLAWIWAYPLTLVIALVFRRTLPALIILPLLHVVSLIAWLAIARPSA